MDSETQQGVCPFPATWEELPGVRKQKRWHLRENMGMWSLLALGQALKKSIQKANIISGAAFLNLFPNMGLVTRG